MPHVIILCPVIALTFDLTRQQVGIIFEMYSGTEYILTKLNQ